MADVAQAHFEHTFGSGGKELSVDHGVRILAFADRGRDAVHCVTLGLSDLPVSAMHPTELICSVRPEQVEAARFLLAATVRVAVDGGGVLTLGATIANPTPLLAGTQICGVLLTAGLFFDDFDLVTDDDDDATTTASGSTSSPSCRSPAVTSSATRRRAGRPSRWPSTTPRSTSSTSLATASASDPAPRERRT